MKCILIGCGGVGSYLAPPLARTMKFALPNSTLILMDGDTVEEKNLNRQLFRDTDIGRKKADALFRQLRSLNGESFAVEADPRYVAPQFDWQNHAPEIGDVVICAVDNHPARRALLLEADRRGFVLILAANEDVAAEAYVYTREWKSHATLDPRVKYPSMLTDNSDDPVHPEGCTGEAALESAPQTAEANYVASALALRLFGAWAIKGKDMEREYRKYLPSSFVSNFSSITTLSVDAAMNAGKERAA